MSEFLLPHSKFLNEKNNTALRRLRENLAVLEAWLLKDDLRKRDLRAISDQVACFRDALSFEGGVKTRQTEPEACKLAPLPTLSPKAAIRRALSNRPLAP